MSRRKASAARDRLPGGHPLSPEERLRLASVSVARWRYTDRLLGRGVLGIIGVGSVVVLTASVPGLPPTLHAARGEGIRGVFTAQAESCARTCTWDGTFTAASGKARPGITYDDALPASTRPSRVPALYPGGSNEVFATRGSLTWVTYAVTVPWLSPGFWPACGSARSGTCAAAPPSGRRR